MSPNHTPALNLKLTCDSFSVNNTKVKMVCFEAKNEFRKHLI